MDSKIHLIDFWLDVEYFDQSTKFPFLANYNVKLYREIFTDSSFHFNM